MGNAFLVVKCTLIDMWFQNEPDNLLTIIECPGWNNLDTSYYEENVGVLDEETGQWQWNEQYKEWYPEKTKKSNPSWEDIINASIETGAWDELEEKSVEDIVEQIISRSKK